MILPWRDVRIGDGPPISTSLTEAEASRLRELAMGREVLEVGSAYGFSAITMAAACPSTRVLAIDPHEGENPDSLAVMRANLLRYGVADRVTIVLGRSENVLRQLHTARFGLVFIDGDHSTAAVRLDVIYGRSLLAPGGVLACHDYGEVTCPGVREAIDGLLDDGLLAKAPTELVDTLWIRRA